MQASTRPLHAESAGPADLPAARAEHHGQVVDIRPLQLERINRAMIARARTVRAAEERAACPGRPGLRLVAGGER